MLSKIICDYQSNDDDSDGDEVYVVVAAMKPGWGRPSESLVGAWATTIYEDMNSDDWRVPNLMIWGPSSTQLAIPRPKDAEILVTLMESDGGTPNLAVVTASIRAFVKAKLPSGVGYSLFNFGAALWQGAVEAYPELAGQHRIGTLTLPFTESELEAARAGDLVFKELKFNAGNRGIYRLRFQMGRVGIASVPW
jgi:hypothetical protein